jgi:hypothetical protein
MVRDSPGGGRDAVAGHVRGVPDLSNVKSLRQEGIAASRTSGQWNDDDFDVLADDAVVGRIFRSEGCRPPDRQWMWTLACGYHEDHTPTHGFEPTREAAMAAFAKSWRRG